VPHIHGVMCLDSDQAKRLRRVINEADRHLRRIPGLRQVHLQRVRMDSLYKTVGYCFKYLRLVPMQLRADIWGVRPASTSNGLGASQVGRPSVSVSPIRSTKLIC
jgi:hypothetical protein